VSVIALIPDGPNATVSRTQDDFDQRGGAGGSSVLILNIDLAQLKGPDSNVSYNLRVGSEYRDHREQGKRELTDTAAISILPGGSVIVETEESVHLPRMMFGYIVPRVFWLQRGLSNTVSKIDPGYNGRLLLSLFNLGKQTVAIRKGDPICALVLHTVADGATLYTKGAKRITGDAGRHAWRRIRDFLQANGDIVAIVLMLVTVLQILIAILRN
jgi:dCTP deaminase